MGNLDKNLSQNYNLDSNQKIDGIDINLIDIIESIFRRKIYFFSIFLISLGLGYLKTFDDPVWQGEFQIVIRNKNSSAKDTLNDLGSTSSILSLLNNGGMGNDLKTEVKILESSSVLNPTFNFVKKEKKIKNSNSKIKFKKWKDSLSVQLIEGTTVLNLKYRDTDKNLIIPVLNKISNTYQEYSNRDRKNSLNKGINYLEEQNKKLKKISQNSLNELMKFSIENNYFSLNQVETLNKSPISQESSLTFNFDSIKNAPNVSQLALLSQLETLALEKSSIFKQDSEVMKQLNNRIKVIKDSISKPTESLIKYRNLSKKAKMDEIISINIEKQLEMLKLEKARQETPWELISAPTIMDDPVGPGKLRILAISILSGVFFGTIFSLLIDKKSGLIFNINQVYKLIPYPFIRKIKIKNKDYINKLLRMLLKNNLNVKEIVLLPVFEENISNPVSKELDFLNKNIEDTKIFISNDFEKNNEKIHILVIKKSKTTLALLEEYLKDIQLLSISVIGWIFIED